MKSVQFHWSLKSIIKIWQSSNFETYLQQELKNWFYCTKKNNKSLKVTSHFLFFSDLIQAGNRLSNIILGRNYGTIKPKSGKYESAFYVLCASFYTCSFWFVRNFVDVALLVRERFQQLHFLVFFNNRVSPIVTLRSW